MSRPAPKKRALSWASVLFRRPNAACLAGFDGNLTLPLNREVVPSRVRWVGRIAFAAFAVTTAACIDLGSHSCLAVEFTCDETSIALQSPNDAWTSGTYTLAMVVDGASQECTMQIPDPPAAAQGTCSATGTTLSLAPICPLPPAVCNAGVCSQTVSSADCIPVSWSSLV